MPYWREKVPLGMERDARIKLTPEDKKRVIELYETGLWSQRKLAREFNVSRRLIQFIINPETKTKNLRRRKERGGSKTYYKKENHRKYMKRHRHRKQNLISDAENPRLQKNNENDPIKYACPKSRDCDLDAYCQRQTPHTHCKGKCDSVPSPYCEFPPRCVRLKNSDTC